MNVSEKPKLSPAGGEAARVHAPASDMRRAEPPAAVRAALVFYDSIFSFVFMLTYWLAVPNEREGSINFMTTRPIIGWAIILAGSSAAFCYNMSVFVFTMVASALAVMVATNLLKVGSLPGSLPQTELLPPCLP